MKRRDLKVSIRNKLMDYTLGEEIFSAVSHGLGALFSMFATAHMVVLSAVKHSPLAVVCGAIYGATLIILFMMSTLYHAIANKKAKLVFRVLDHTTIFLLIAGTYTPLSLITLGGALGWVVFGVEWGIAAVGIVFNAISIEKFKVFSMIGYVVSGWMIVIAALPLYRSIAFAGLMYLVGGGLFYTIGILFYSLKKIRYMHSIWHIFVVIGAVLQYIAVATYVLPTVY